MRLWTAAIALLATSLVSVSLGCESRPSADVGVPAPKAELGPSTASSSSAASPARASAPVQVPSASASPSASADPAGASPAPLVERTRGTPIDHDFSAGPQAFTASFDGSQRFSMWLQTIDFAARLETRHQRPAHFTYFINTCYYALGIEGSGIGRARSQDEVLVRSALTQMAINRGHEVGNHGVRHLDGTRWSTAEWRKELDEFHRVTDVMLFEPILGADGRPVFPRFASLPASAPGQAGGSCGQANSCEGGPCVSLEGDVRICSAPCNRHKPCPEGMVCGAPTFQDDTDLCLPKPVFPIQHAGETLFDERGRPNLRHPRLRPYRIDGFRAPFLVFSDSLVESLIERKYAYDASSVLPFGPPVVLRQREGGPTLLELPLMAPPDAKTVPMDYNYDRIGAGEAEVLEDYQRGLLAAAGAGRIPWSVGHHFAQWRDGAYWKALQRTLVFAAEGCPAEGGAKRCPNLQIVSFRELTERLAGTP